MRPRPYQRDCLDASRSAFQSADSALAVLATGLGKTVIFAHLAKDWPGRVLVLAHRDELIRQAAEKLASVTGEYVGVEMGQERTSESPMTRPRIVCTSVQTMCRADRQARFRPGEFGLVITDEAHHATSPSYASVYKHFLSAGAKHFGVTATAKRHDQIRMRDVFSAVAYEFEIGRAIDEGWLVPVRQHAVHVEGLDFSGVSTRAGDFDEAELEKILTDEKIVHRIASPVIDAAGDEPALVFCVNVAHAKVMAAILERYKPRSAEFLSGASDAEDRKRVVRQYKDGSLQFLCNCSLFLEGFDAPNTSLVVMARPTESLPLYTQILGRGTRTLPGVIDPFAEGTAEQRREAIRMSAKPCMTILDFVGNSGKHKIIAATDLLGGKHGPQVRDYARKTAEDEGCPAEVAESLDRAADELDLIDEIDQMAKVAAALADQRERDRRRQIQASADYSTQEVSPFDLAASPGGVAIDEAPPPDPATKRQVDYLVYQAGWKRETAERLGRRQASAVISKHKGPG